MLITGSFCPEKTKAFFNLMKKQDDDNVTDEIYLYIKDLNEAKYQYLIKKREKMALNTIKFQKSLLDYSDNMQYVYQEKM